MSHSMKLIINNNKSQTRVEMSALGAFCVEGRAYMREATRGTIMFFHLTRGSIFQS